MRQQIHDLYMITP